MQTIRRKPIAIHNFWNFNTTLHQNINVSRLANFETEFLIQAGRAREFFSFFKKHTFTFSSSLIDIVVYDEPNKSWRFTAIYCFNNYDFNTKFYVTTKFKEGVALFSLTGFYCAAGWAEREIWDMYGVFFRNNNDLRRILTDYNFTGHPLRRDFPLSGYVDVFYDDKKKHLVYTPIEISQEYRNFTFSSPWSKN